METVKKVFLFLGILAIIIAIPLTVYILLRRTAIRKEAAVPGGPTTAKLLPQTGTYNLGDTFDVQIKVNTANIGISVIQVYLTYGYDRTLEIEIQDADGNPANGKQIQPGNLEGLNYITNDVTLDEPSKKVIIRLAALISDPEKPYRNNVDSVFGTIQFKALAPVENRTLSFDQELSKITNAETAEDILLIPTNGFYTVKGETQPTAPVITGFTPASGQVSTTVNIEGSNFGTTRGDSTVKFGSYLAEETPSWAERNISAVVPETAQPGQVNIIVTTTGGTATSSQKFNILETPPEIPHPVITDFTPSGGPTGTLVTITGDHFGDSRGTGNVKFNKTTATFFEEWKNTRIKVQVPTGATTGRISVITEGGTATSSKNFDVEEPGGTPPEDTTPPDISGVSATEITASSAKITWTTDEAATSQVEYGTTSTYGSTTPKDSSLVLTHNVSLTGLSATTVYHFKVDSEDSSGNAASSSDLNFTTLAASDTTPPVISSINVLDITQNSARITWKTDEAATSQVEYGTTTAYGFSTVKDTSLSTTHSQSLSGLEKGTEYHFRVNSDDSAGNPAHSLDHTFTTLSPPTGGPESTEAAQATGSAELPTTGIEDYINYTLLMGIALILLGLFLPKFAFSHEENLHTRRLRRFEEKITRDER